jgi:hypothetical protein
MILYSHTTRRTYENRPESKFFQGGKNESYCYTYTETYIEADIDEAGFNRYAELSDSKFDTIKDDGFVVRCYKFNKIHSSQERDFVNDKNSAEWWYEHRIFNGFYNIEDQEENRARWITVYDTKNKRIYKYRCDKW